jgi:Concanavalin A-like lectin/glucanases superfamily
MWINGQLVASNTTAPASVTNTSNLYIGMESGFSCCNGNYDGLLDDVRIYNRALSADEIKRLYNMGR